MSENFRTYSKALFMLDAVAARVPDGAWDNPSCCEGWTDGILLTRPFVVPEWPSDDELPVDGMYVADIWDLPSGLGADGYR